MSLVLNVKSIQDIGKDYKRNQLNEHTNHNMEQQIKNLQNETLALTRRVIKLENDLKERADNLTIGNWINELEIKLNAQILDSRRDLSKEINVAEANIRQDLTPIEDREDHPPELKKEVVIISTKPKNKFRWFFNSTK